MIRVSEGTDNTKLKEDKVLPPFPRLFFLPQLIGVIGAIRIAILHSLAS